jgi:hypothetical protein
LLFSKKDTGRFPQPGEVEQRYALLKDGKELPPLAYNQRKGIVARLLSLFAG